MSLCWGGIGFFFFFRRGDAVRYPNGQLMEDTGHGRAPTPISVERYHKIHRFDAIGPSAIALMFYLQTAINLGQIARRRRLGVISSEKI